jgi:hypothetical protein
MLFIVVPFCIRRGRPPRLVENVAPECGNAKSLASADMEHGSIRQKQSEQAPKPGAEKPQSKPQDVKEIGGR